ncbi:hypothetical protein [Spiroplasma endosymbiont of Cantharis lateralis]|uniref:hypothetical protein n=1 Tax=Spiroplasma endosymbiont of Cantharis lateralis TaxID=3066277 RepID=UPI00313CE864
MCPKKGYTTATKKYVSFHMFRNNIKKVYTNKNGNEFAVILISKTEDKEAKFLNISTKLVQNYEYSTEEGKVLKRSEKSDSPFIQINLPSDGELSISIKNKEIEAAEFENHKVKVSEVFNDLLEISNSTYSWAKSAKANWNMDQVNKLEPSKNQEFDIIDEPSANLEDNQILLED